MKAIRMQNLRSLADTGFIELKPITLLLGQNSSGKSTFLRMFPLLRQSVETRTSGPILWFGRLVDFGDFQTAVGKYGDSEEITLGFKIQYERETGIMRLSEQLKLTLKLVKNNENITWVKTCEASLLEHTFEMEIDGKGKLTQFRVNTIDFINLNYNLPIKPTTKIIPSFSFGTYDDLFSKQLYDYLEKIFGDEELYLESPGSLIELLGFVTIGSTEDMLVAIKDVPHVGDTELEARDYDRPKNIRNTLKRWDEITSTWTVDTPEFQFIRDSLIADRINTFLIDFDKYITNYAQNTYYIAPTRATAERYYRTQDLAIDEVDFQGRNLAMFLWSLGEEKRQQFSAWTEKVLGFSVSVQLEGGHISLMLKEPNLETKFNIADMGFGFSQILPIVTQLWAISHGHTQDLSPNLIHFTRYYPLPITFAIEQPELHLHPTLQAKLADAFLAAIKEAKERKIDLRLIIETHSEVIISRLGHRVAHQEITPEEINVVLFDKKDAHSPTEIRIAQYDEQGYLTNWPFGFFEPDRI